MNIFKRTIIEYIYECYCKIYLKPLMSAKIKKASRNEWFREQYSKEIDYLKEKGIDFIPYECDEIECSEAFYDKSSGTYYSNVYGKKLFFKDDVGKKQAQKNIKQLLREQCVKSPHLYIEKENQFFDDGDVILIDTGSAEGNFSLEYIDRCKKVYLIEADKGWNEALNKTFMPYSEKVTIINKLISDKTEGEYSTLDNLFSSIKHEKIFIKMDIEGYGLSALKGARELLASNDVFVANASYHSDDEFEKIQEYVENDIENYVVEAPQGYVLFWYDRKLKYPFFRRGMCRIRKRENGTDYR